MNRSAELVKESTANLQPQDRVLAVSGSPRRNGNSDTLVRQILDGVSEAGVDSESVRLRDVQFQGCIGCEKCRRDRICTGLLDGMSLVYPKIIASKGLVLVSPTHHYNITSWMKAFIDRLYCFYEFSDRRPGPWSSRLADQGRSAVVVAVCEQENAEDMGFTLEAMRMPLDALGSALAQSLNQSDGAP
jgi:multimeric flavodoxin WrbA